MTTAHAGTSKKEGCAHQHDRSQPPRKPHAGASMKEGHVRQHVCSQPLCRPTHASTMTKEGRTCQCNHSQPPCKPAHAGASTKEGHARWRDSSQTLRKPAQQRRRARMLARPLTTTVQAYARRHNDQQGGARTRAPALPSSLAEDAQPIAHAGTTARTRAGAHYLLLPTSHR